MKASPRLLVLGAEGVLEAIDAAFASVATESQPVDGPLYDRA